MTPPYDERELFLRVAAIRTDADFEAVVRWLISQGQSELMAREILKACYDWE